MEREVARGRSRRLGEEPNAGTAAGARRRAGALPGRRGAPPLLRDLNVSLLIELARVAGPVSRAELARQSRISAPTVSAIVARLLERGILSEVEVAPSNGGRPPVLLQLNRNAGCAVGIKLRADGLTTVVCDLDARVAATDETSVSLVGNPAAATAAVEQALRRALRQAGVRRADVLGVGIGMPGVIDARRGVCRFSHLLQWYDAELVEPLRRRLRLPVWVDNDVKTLAVAEKWMGEGLNARDFLTLSVGRGVGLGIVIDRSLYRGAVGGAGEFGHMVVDPDGPPCECGAHGCLEAYVGERALCRLVGEQHGGELTRDDLVALAVAGDPATLAVLDDAGRRLGAAVANVVTLLNPELLIICGEGTGLGSAFLGPVVAAVREQTFACLGREVEITLQRWGDEAWAVGAATLVLRESFRIPDQDEASHAIWHRIGA